MIDVQNVSLIMGKSFLVKEVSLMVQAGEFVVIMGPNGAGKSTLLKMMSGTMPPTTGNIFFKGEKLSGYKTEALASHRAVLSQHYHISFPLSVREMVMMGRYPYFKNHSLAMDEVIVDEQMEKMEISHLKDRNYHTLSGGEAQKVHMSRVLAQIGDTSVTQQKLLLLDEPVSHLDIKYQHQLLQEAKLLCHKQVGVAAVLHDVNLALKYADKIFFMKAGQIIRTLSKNEDITAQLLKEVFDVNAAIFDMPDGRGKFVSY